MKLTPTSHAEEICSVLIKTLHGEITWSTEEQEWVLEPNNEYVDAHGRIGEDRDGKKFVLVRKYTGKVSNASYNFWPVLFIINSQEISPETCIVTLCNQTKIPDGSTCYNGYNNEVFNNLLKAIQLVVE